MTRRFRSAPSLIVLGVLLAAAPPPPALAAAPSPLDERVSIELVDAKAGDALTSFSQLTGLRFDVEPGLTVPFTATLRNIRVRTALDVLCESVGCRWQEVAGAPPSVRVSRVAVPSSPAAPAEPAAALERALAEPISLRLKEAAAREVFTSFQQMLGSGLEVAPDITGEITVHLEAVPVRAALDAVCAQAGCTWSIDASGVKPVLRVAKSS